MPEYVFYAAAYPFIGLAFGLVMEAMTRQLLWERKGKNDYNNKAAPELWIHYSLFAIIWPALLILAVLYLVREAVLHVTEKWG